MQQPGATRSRLGRPYRRLNRWVRHTPAREVAQTMIALGVTLIGAAIILAIAIA